MDDFDERLAGRDAADREMEQSRGAEYIGDPGVMYLCMVLSSTGSTAAATTYKCSIVNLTTPETEGAMMATDYDPEATPDLTLLATNITSKRPTTAASNAGLGSTVLVFKVGDRFIMEFW